jgi:hypothetical protein
MLRNRPIPFALPLTITLASTRAQVFAHRLLLTDARAFESELRLVEKARSESLPHDPAAKGGGGDGSFQTNPMCWEITSDGKGIGLDRTSRFALKQANGWRGHA